MGALILVMSVVPGNTGATQKMKPAELVEKHLAAIGTPEARAAVRNRVVKGAARRAPENRIAGNAVFVSEGRSVRLGLPFSTLDYEGEDLVFDGNKLWSGMRGQLSVFRVLIKEGLMGGTLTTAWALADVAGRRPGLKYKGLKKRGGQEYHELQYLPRKVRGDIRVLVYFDPQTFRHVQTEYRIVEEYYARGKYWITRTLTEEFADFTIADDLTLPSTYKLRITEGRSRNIDTTEWKVAFEQIRHNEQLDPKTFVTK